MFNTTSIRNWYRNTNDFIQILIPMVAVAQIAVFVGCIVPVVLGLMPFTYMLLFFLYAAAAVVSYTSLMAGIVLLSAKIQKKVRVSL